MFSGGELASYFGRIFLGVIVIIALVWAAITMLGRFGGMWQWIGEMF